MSEVDKEISRVTRPKEVARASYDRMSRWYDTIASSEARFRVAGLDRLDAQPGETILEIGFGTGHGIVALAQAVGDEGRVYGIDLSQGMCDITQTRVEESGLAHRVSLICGDAAASHFAAGTFDAVFISFTLELFDTPEIPLVLAEVKKVLKDEGRLVLVILSRENAGLAVRIYEWFHEAMPRYVDCRPIYIRPILQEAGFQVVDSSRMTMWGLPVNITMARKNGQPSQSSLI